MPNFDESEIVVDVIKQEDDVGIFQLVLSEMSPGGIGLIEDWLMNLLLIQECFSLLLVL